MTTFTIQERTTGSVIASAEENEQVQLLEGSLYFAPEAVDMTHLRITDRTYVCPYKGVCYWYDLESGQGRAQNIAWVYNDPKPGYEHIKGRIAFYNRETAGTVAIRENAADPVGR